uniref:Uncharacterized protein n=1 Tax=Pristionchus pacificus TaxID=54126 RepID=A0A2A6CMP3_PRIPA|eukprot:PDM79357.1 hypothetical protein PRIPAC_31936 [Pristionchus pacificus]
MEMNAKAYARSVCREMTSGWKKKREKDFLSGEEGEKWAETWGREKEEKKEGEIIPKPKNPGKTATRKMPNAGVAINVKGTAI